MNIEEQVEYQKAGIRGSLLIIICILIGIFGVWMMEANHPEKYYTMLTGAVFILAFVVSMLISWRKIKKLRNP